MLQDIYSGGLEIMTEIMHLCIEKLTKKEALSFQKILITFLLFTVGAQRKGVILNMITKVLYDKNGNLTL